MTKEICCGELGVALAHRPVLLERRRSGAIVIPVHDGDLERGRRGLSGVQISFCPWSGDALRPIDRRDDTVRADGDHDCDFMRVATKGEDLIIVHDEKTEAYLLPIFDGGHETNCVGNEGIEIVYCPGCGGMLVPPENVPRRDGLVARRNALPFGTRSPRY